MHDLFADLMCFVGVSMISIGLFQSGRNALIPVYPRHRPTARRGAAYHRMRAGLRLR